MVCRGAVWIEERVGIRRLARKLRNRIRRQERMRMAQRKRIVVMIRRRKGVRVRTEEVGGDEGEAEVE